MEVAESVKKVLDDPDPLVFVHFRVFHQVLSQVKHLFVVTRDII
jgi:hypothetical protein